MNTRESTDKNIVHLCAKTRDSELQRINRLTGLCFESVPTSLLNQPEEWRGFTESLCDEAMSVWRTAPQRADG
jgi:hypothetical protein